MKSLSKILAATILTFTIGFGADSNAADPMGAIKAIKPVGAVADGGRGMWTTGYVNNLFGIKAGAGLNAAQLAKGFNTLETLLNEGKITPEYHYILFRNLIVHGSKKLCEYDRNTASGSCAY